MKELKTYTGTVAIVIGVIVAFTSLPVLAKIVLGTIGLACGLHALIVTLKERKN